MGIGDEVMASGFARGAVARGKRIAFGDGKRIIWGPWCKEAFRNNPNIAWQANEANIEWKDYYKGHRGYNSADNARRRWIWNYDFKAPIGEFFWDAMEKARTMPRRGACLIEPNVPWHKSVSVNKDWGRQNYQRLADLLAFSGWRILQTSHGKVRLEHVETIQVNSFRDAAAVIASVDLAIVPEGGLHHAAAAVGTNAIVLHGGFTPPAVLGYSMHVNLTGTNEACGNWDRCLHCRRALDSIEVEHVYVLADATLRQKNTTASSRVGGISSLHSAGQYSQLS